MFSILPMNSTTFTTQIRNTMDHPQCNPEILKLLSEKSSTKQFVFRQTKALFDDFKKQLETIANELNRSICDIDANVVVTYKDTGMYEAQIHFSGDVIVFQMHTNVFTFESNHMIWKNSYVKEDELRGYFGVIHMYNFLADSFKYQRNGDYGYLMGRIFINKDKHFFVEGKRQFGFLYNNVASDVIDQDKMRQIIERSIIYALDFDLTTPDFNQMREITVGQMLAQGDYANLSTRKRLGFRLSYDKNKAAN
jgi:hypothetical protein